MKTLYIAEKPDIAASMAAYLWPNDYKSLKDKHCYTKGDTTVTWAYGHILMLCMPEAYGEQFKEFKNYPIIPVEWLKEPSPSSKEQFYAIKKMLKDADIVVNGGDPDREGQLLVDEILVFTGYNGRVNRILINAKDDASMKRAFDTIDSNDNFRNLYLAGLAREYADWLVGMNLSRCYSVNAKKNGVGAVWKIGRVKVPTLSLVVSREKEIENFRPVDYFVLVAKCSKDGIAFTATFEPKEDSPTDSEGRILDCGYLARVLHEIEGKQCKVTAVENKTGTESAPLPYSLDTLQVEANRRYGMSPKSVLDIVQTLYEKKFVSYPRSDCNYIPSSQHADAGRILNALGNYGIAVATNADKSLVSKAYNDKKVSAHHAIIPTGVIPKDLNEWERKIYDMIALRYIVQFYPPCKFDTVKYKVESEDYVFTGSGKKVTHPGWKIAISKCDESVPDADSASNAESSYLPNLVSGDILMPPQYETESKQTTPPKRFTEGTLLAAMTNIWRFVSPDNPNRELLKECKGIGTPATRDTIISELMSDKSGKSAILPCIRKVGKELQPTAFGRCLIDNIDETLTKPDFTATMELHLSMIADGRMSFSSFMKDMEKLVMDNIEYADHHKFSTSDGLKEESGTANGGDNVPQMECPVCHKTTLERKYSPKTKSHFWVCCDKDCVHPVTGKTLFFTEERKKPLVKLCPTCKTVATRIFSKKTNKYYWFCPKCDGFINESNDNKKSVTASKSKNNK